MSITKLFQSASAGAPVLSGSAGSLIAVLDACLVNGFGTVSVVSLTVAAGVATANFSAGHSFSVDAVGLFANSTVTGAAPGALNGEKRILTISTNTVSFAAVGVADQTASGAITAKVAGAGWTKAFTGVNKAAYRNNFIDGTGFYLRVDDTGTTTARVRGYETMTDVDTGVGLFPSIAQQALPGLFWSKSEAASAVARTWFVIADTRGVFFVPRPQLSSGNHHTYYFGDVNSLKSNDPYACMIRGNTTDASAAAAGAQDLHYVQKDYLQGGCFLARASTALGGSFPAHHSASTVMPASSYYSGGSGLPYPSPIDNSLNLSDCVIHNENGNRAILPGIKYSTQITNLAFSTGDLVLGSGSLAGRKLFCVRTGTLTGTQSSVLFFDHISNWR